MIEEKPTAKDKNAGTKYFVESIVHNQFYKYLMDNNLLHSSQHGFRKKRSTQTALIKVVGEWLSNIDNGQVSAVIFLDLAKAFHTVKHSILVRKLQALPLFEEEAIY